MSGQYGTSSLFSFYREKHIMGDTHARYTVHGKGGKCPFANLWP
jgi:hypothetical protein